MAGKRTKLTPEIQERICGYVNAGASIPQACEAAGVSWFTVRDWLAKGRAGKQPYASFVEATKKAKAAWVVGSAMVITKAGKKDWRAAAWLLERRVDEFRPPTQRVDLAVAFEEKVAERFQRLKTLVSPAAWAELERAFAKIAAERSAARADQLTNPIRTDG